ncbi:hypothetical protein Ahy_B05g075018 [Arachis hypogaea]|uniref:Uncharacterized protein n=1 Tax=Arachis hypogaea TaxID=3818 RepID=A0A444Z0C0_ARAHY|nr:hypothetical protein Ahy_B05g075018 [Arachis hypogaea]
MCIMGIILQDHFKLDSDIVAEAIRPLVEIDPFLKVKFIIAEVQPGYSGTMEEYNIEHSHWVLAFDEGH